MMIETINANRNVYRREDDYEANNQPFFRYISIDTQGDDQASCCPSNENQRLLADLLCEELKEFGVTDVRVDENSFLYAKISSNLDTPCAFCGFSGTP